MSCEQPTTVFQGNTKVLAVKFISQSTGLPLDLDTDVTAIEFEVKKADGDADPAFIHKDLLGGIVKRVQAGDDLGVADITIDSGDTTATNPDWPVAPDNVGVFRYDVVVTLTSGQRYHAIPPSDFIVKAPVNFQ